MHVLNVPEMLRQLEANSHPPLSPDQKQAAAQRIVHDALHPFTIRLRRVVGVKCAEGGLYTIDAVQSSDKGAAKAKMLATSQVAQFLLENLGQRYHHCAFQMEGGVVRDVVLIVEAP